MANEQKEKKIMPYYGSAYGVKHYGSEGMKPAGGTPATSAPGSTPQTPAVPPAAIPEPQQQVSDPMGDAIAKLMASLQAGANSGPKGTGNPFLDRLQSSGNDMWRYFGKGG